MANTYSLTNKEKPIIWLRFQHETVTKEYFESTKAIHTMNELFIYNRNEKNMKTSVVWKVTECHSPCKKSV